MSEVFDKRYLINGVLGNGRVSTVYQATDTFDGKTVALKVFNSKYIPGTKSLKCLDELLEERMEISHPNIVRLLAKGIDKSELRPTLYLVMEYVEGASLWQRLSRLGVEPFTLQEILQILLQVIDALSYLHTKGISISSLDPKRILIRETNAIKLPAFGFTSTSQWIRDHSQVSGVSGIDYRYIAPEMIDEHGITEGNFATDVYLLGLLAFELGCGAAPFDANRTTVIQLHQTEPVPETLRESGLPVWYDTFARRCLAKDPAQRPGLEELRIFIESKISSGSQELAAAPTCIARSGVRVLFVEDNKLDQLSLARSAKRDRYPFTYKMAYSVAQAVKFIENREFEVIVSDYMLPDGTAVDVIAAAKGIPVVVITGAGREDVAARVLRAGAFDYLAKDIQQQHLRAIPHVVMRAWEHANKEQKQKEVSGIDVCSEIKGPLVPASKFTEKIGDMLSLSLEYHKVARVNVERPEELVTALNVLGLALKNLQSLLAAALGEPAFGSHCKSSNEHEICIGKIEKIADPESAETSVDTEII